MRTFRTLFLFALKLEFTSIGRLITPLLFGLSMLVLFSFAFADMPSEIIPSVFIATTTLTAFLALQLAFSRAFEHDELDHVFDYMRTYPVHPSAWYLAKFCHVFVSSSLVLIPVLGLSVLFHSLKVQSALAWPMIAALFGVLFGLASIGVLLAALMLKASSKQILFPLLYFPLVSPILIAAVETGLLVMKPTVNDNQLLAWLALIGIFDCVYFVLGLLFFEEVIQTS